MMVPDSVVLYVCLRLIADNLNPWTLYFLFRDICDKYLEMFDLEVKSWTLVVV